MSVSGDCDTGEMRDLKVFYEKTKNIDACLLYTSDAADE